MGYHAIITGASSGIGAALAEVLAAEGYAVGLIARRAERLDEVAERVRATGGVAATAAADVTDPAALRQAIAALEAALGPCELLVANAGVAVGTPMDPLDLAHNRQVLATNLYAPVQAFAAVLPGMLRRGRGVLVSVSSLAGYRGLPTQSAYCASKAGLSAFATGLRADLRGRGVHVLDVCPGFVTTEMTAKAPFPTPGALTATDAARRIARALRARQDHLAFPWFTAVGMLLMRLLPGGLFAALSRRVLAPRPRGGAGPGGAG